MTDKRLLEQMTIEEITLQLRDARRREVEAVEKLSVELREAHNRYDEKIQEILNNRIVLETEVARRGQEEIDRRTRQSQQCPPSS